MEAKTAPKKPTKKSGQRTAKTAKNVVAEKAATKRTSKVQRGTSGTGKGTSGTGPRIAGAADRKKAKEKPCD
ncbi:MAG: hypothetical protein WBF45_20445 [Acidobacteriaceae bacterium]